MSLIAQWCAAYEKDMLFFNEYFMNIRDTVVKFSQESKLVKLVKAESLLY